MATRNHFLNATGLMRFLVCWPRNMPKSAGMTAKSEASDALVEKLLFRPSPKARAMVETVKEKPRA